MSGPALLVHDDIAQISTVRRLLTGEGMQVVLAGSVADAIIAFGHHRPELVILSPRVEGGRGALVVDELRGHPDAIALRLLVLGTPLSGIDAPVASVPITREDFLLQLSAARSEERRVGKDCSCPGARNSVTIRYEVLHEAQEPDGQAY